MTEKANNELENVTIQEEFRRLYDERFSQVRNTDEFIRSFNVFYPPAKTYQDEYPLKLDP